MVGKFMSIVRTNIWITSVAKNSKIRICRFMVKKSLKLRLVVKKWSGQMIDKMNSSEECMVQKIEKNVGLS